MGVAARSKDAQSKAQSAQSKAQSAQQEAPSSEREKNIIGARSTIIPVWGDAWRFDGGKIVVKCLGQIFPAYNSYTSREAGVFWCKNLPEIAKIKKGAGYFLLIFLLKTIIFLKWAGIMAQNFLPLFNEL